MWITTTIPEVIVGMKPKGCTESELAKVGVELVDPNKLKLRCKKCGLLWSPKIVSGGRLPKGYWICSNGCNEE